MDIHARNEKIFLGTFTLENIINSFSYNERFNKLYWLTNSFLMNYARFKCRSRLHRAKFDET